MKKIQKLTRHIVATGAQGPKVCLNFMGLKVGNTRRPIIMGDTVSYELREELRIELENLGLVEKKTITFPTTNLTSKPDFAIRHNSLGGWIPSSAEERVSHP